MTPQSLAEQFAEIAETYYQEVMRTRVASLSRRLGEKIRSLAATLPEGVFVPREFLKRCKRSHYYCEDSWYSCPQAPEGCADQSQGTKCDCGADERNAEIDALLAAAEKEEQKGETT